MALLLQPTLPAGQAAPWGLRAAHRSQLPLKRFWLPCGEPKDKLPQHRELSTGIFIEGLCELPPPPPRAAVARLPARRRCYRGVGLKPRVFTDRVCGTLRTAPAAAGDSAQLSCSGSVSRGGATSAEGDRIGSGASGAPAIPHHAHTAGVRTRAAPLPSHSLHEVLSRSRQPGSALSLHALRSGRTAAWVPRGRAPAPAAQRDPGPSSTDGPEAAGPAAAARVHACLPAETQPLVAPGAGAGGKYVCKQEVKLLCSAASLIIFAGAAPAVEGGF